MVDVLVGEGTIRSAAVEAAMRAVPREVFAAPATALDPLAAGYVCDPHVALPLRRVGGRHPATISAPDVVADMLEWLDLRAGMRVLEIGAGSGYNAALLATLVGDPALVTTIEVDPVVAEMARTALEATGFGAVSVVVADGEAGWPPGAPWDRIEATVGVAAIPPAWVAQLTPDGKLLAPVGERGQHPLVLGHPDTTGGVVTQTVGLTSFVQLRHTGDDPG